MVRLSQEELKAKYKQARETAPIMEEHKNALVQDLRQFGNVFEEVSAQGGGA